MISIKPGAIHVVVDGVRSRCRARVPALGAPIRGFYVKGVPSTWSPVALHPPRQGVLGTTLVTRESAGIPATCGTGLRDLKGPAGDGARHPVTGPLVGDEVRNHHLSSLTHRTTVSVGLMVRCTVSRGCRCGVGVRAGDFLGLGGHENGCQVLLGARRSDLPGVIEEGRRGDRGVRPKVCAHRAGSGDRGPRSCATAESDQESAGAAAVQPAGCRGDVPGLGQDPRLHSSCIGIDPTLSVSFSPQRQSRSHRQGKSRGGAGDGRA